MVGGLVGFAQADATTLSDLPEIDGSEQCLDPSSGSSFAAETLGFGSESFPITASGMIEDTHYVVSRHMSLTPGVIAGFNVDTGERVYQEDVVIDGEESEGTWGATVAGDYLYVGMSFTGDRRSSILRLDHDSQELEEVASTAPAALIWDMTTAPDGTIYAATSRQNGAGLWEYDPEDENAEFLGQFEENTRQDARSVAATEDTVYLGLGNAEPDLIAYDRDSGESESILPDELDDASYVYSLEANEDVIVAGTSSPATLTVLDPDDPDEYDIVDVPSGTVQVIEIVDDMVYFTGGSSLWSYDLDEEELEKLSEVDIPGGQTRGLYHRDGVLHGSGNLGQLWSYGLDGGEFNVIDMVEEAGEGTPEESSYGEPAQSLAAADGLVYTGGHFTVGVRDPENDQLTQLDVPGEPKGTQIVDGVLYMAMYSSGNLVSYDLESEEMETLASAPRGHNRPRDLHYDAKAGQLYMTVQADTGGGGSLLFHDIDSGNSETYEPFDDHAVSAVTSGDETVYVAGSSGMQDSSDGAALKALDPDDGDTFWEIDFDEDLGAITGLQALDDNVYAITSEGSVLSIHPGSQDVYEIADGFGPGDLIEHQGEIYGATAELLFTIDRDAGEVEILLEDLNGQWFTWPSLASDGCSIYAMHGAEVAQIGSDEPVVDEPSDGETVPGEPEETDGRGTLLLMMIAIGVILVAAITLVAALVVRRRSIRRDDTVLR
ncbi:MAG: hypothetical protein ACTJFS_08955 [Micrococcaceae bacterium]